MDQGTLVGIQTEDGQRLIDRLTDEGIVVTAAAWLKESDTGEWFLYLATPLVGEDRATRPAYRRVAPLVRQLRMQGSSIGSLEVKLIGPDDPLAQAVTAARDRYPGRMPSHIHGDELERRGIDEAYVYPLPPARPNS